ncbi:MAG: hypothetical protein EPN20_04520 [Magnetospirillum sp.]|nr:MAG: hypothetical protein EPN20_04520 [Magnetospirillum sp.]
MTIDLTDWAALLEALDGIKGHPPTPPPLPVVTSPLVPSFAAAQPVHRRRPRRLPRQPFPAAAMPRSQ